MEVKYFFKGIFLLLQVNTILVKLIKKFDLNLYCYKTFCFTYGFLSFRLRLNGSYHMKRIKKANLTAYHNVFGSLDISKFNRYKKHDREIHQVIVVG